MLHVNFFISNKENTRITHLVELGPTEFSAIQSTACRFTVGLALTTAENAPRTAAAPPQSPFIPTMDV